MGEYEAPQVEELGSVDDLTLTYHKTDGTGDATIGNGIYFGS